MGSTTPDQSEGSAGRQHAARDALLGWTAARLSPPAASWLQETLAAAGVKRTIDIAFGLAPRKTGRAMLDLTDAEQLQAQSLITGWTPHHLRLDEAARLLIALAGLEHLPDTLERLIRHADIDEQCAIYRGLCILPTDVDVDDIVGRGLRTHANPVFESIAHHNPWTATRFDEHRWNHLVLKAMFMEVSLWPIADFDKRRNPELSRMALDFAAERRAAERRVPAELFRCVAPFTTLAAIKVYIQDVADDATHAWPDTAPTRALSLALHDAADAELREVVRARSPHLKAIEAGTLDWSNHLDREGN